MAFRTGEQPITLPCIELDPVTLKCRKHGSVPEDIDKLVESVIDVIKFANSRILTTLLQRIYSLDA
ncbi:MAG: hypothetical protein DDT19_02603 [Syntrophomonadaceae bacterium]|nr:hypothetical protein [Bacillota bacterium]